MTRRDLVYLVGMVLVAALLLANLIRPTQPEAYALPETGPAVAISAAGDSAWAIVGNRVYFVSLKTRSELQDTTIRVIQAKDLN